MRRILYLAERGYLLLVITIILIAIILRTDGLPMFRKKMWREFTTLSVLLGIALLLAIGYKLGIPGPIAFLDKLLYPLGKAIL